MEYDYKVTMISVSRVFYTIFQTAGIPLTVSQSSAFPTLIAIAFILLFFTDKKRSLTVLSEAKDRRKLDTFISFLINVQIFVL